MKSAPSCRHCGDCPSYIKQHEHKYANTEQGFDKREQDLADLKKHKAYLESLTSFIADKDAGVVLLKAKKVAI